MVVDLVTYGISVFDVFSVSFNLGLQYGRRIYAEGHDSDSFLSRQLVGGGLEGGYPNGWMWFLEWFGQHLARWDVPELAFPFEEV